MIIFIYQMSTATIWLLLLRPDSYRDSSFRTTIIKVKSSFSGFNHSS